MIRMLSGKTAQLGAKGGRGGSAAGRGAGVAACRIPASTSMAQRSSSASGRSSPRAAPLARDRSEVEIETTSRRSSRTASISGRLARSPRSIGPGRGPSQGRDGFIVVDGHQNTTDTGPHARGVRARFSGFMRELSARSPAVGEGRGRVVRTGAPTGRFRPASARGGVGVPLSKRTEASGRPTPSARPVGTDFKAVDG